MQTWRVWVTNINGGGRSVVVHGDDFASALWSGARVDITGRCGNVNEVVYPANIELIKDEQKN